METQLAKVKGGNFNPRLIGAGDSIEFTYDFSTAPGAERAVENTREFSTIGDARKKQAEADKYRIRIEWYEPNDNVSERIYLVRDNSGDRTVTFTYIHSKKLTGRALFDANSGSDLIVYIADFTSRRVGVNELGQDSYRCTLTVQEV